jgi:putative transposase
VFTPDKKAEKLQYMHHNPVGRGLVKAPDGWASSSLLHWKTGAMGKVKIESTWITEQKNASLSA